MGFGDRLARARVPGLGAALRLEAADLLRQFAEGVSDLIEDDATAGRQPKHPRAFRPLGLRGTQPPAPGHSPGHLAFYADGALFSGDVLFAGSVGRTDLPMADWATLVDSIRGLVDRFPPETIVYSGHGPETTLGAELARNPFLAELRA